MDIKFFVPYVEAKKRLDIRASIVGRWLEAGSYEDRRGDGVWRRVRTSRMNRDFSVWLLDFKSRGWFAPRSHPEEDVTGSFPTSTRAKSPI